MPEDEQFNDEGNHDPEGSIEFIRCHSLRPLHSQGILLIAQVRLVLWNQGPQRIDELLLHASSVCLEEV